MNHKGHRKTRVFNSSKAAETYAVQVEARLKLGKVDEVFTSHAPDAPSPPIPTFAEAAERWWAVDGANFKGGTRDTYRNILDKRILPIFGPQRLTDIPVAAIEDWWAALRASGLSRKHIGNMRCVLTSIFQRAVTSGLLSRNPAEAIRGRLGREEREVRQVEWLTEAELARFLECSAQREPRHDSFLRLLATTGTRWREALALQVGDVDLARGRIAIRRAIRKHQVRSPKSGKARSVDVPPSTIAVLRRWLDVVRAEAAVRGAEATWLFPNATGQQPMDEVPVRAAFRRCLKGAGIIRRLRPHDLRHTYASLALQRGVPLLVVSRQLGHASIAITADVYGHLMPEATRAAADALEAILGEQSRNPRATPAEASS